MEHLFFAPGKGEALRLFGFFEIQNQKPKSNAISCASFTGAIKAGYTIPEVLAQVFALPWLRNLDDSNSVVQTQMLGGVCARL